MLVLSSSWGGKAEHGILTVDAYILEHILYIYAKDEYYNDYSPTGMPEMEKVCSSEVLVEGIDVDRNFLFGQISDLLEKNRINAYRFDIKDLLLNRQL